MFVTNIGKSTAVVISAKAVAGKSTDAIIIKMKSKDNIKTVFVEYDPLIPAKGIVKRIRSEYPEMTIFIFEDKNKNLIYSDRVVTDFKELAKYNTAGHVTKSYIYNLIDSHDLTPFQEEVDESMYNLNSDGPFGKIITDNLNMKKCFCYLKKIARINRPVLITGESGTGKELFSEAVHVASSFKGEYVTVNFAGLDNNSFSDTLFGHTRGAYTGAVAVRKGLLRSAENGSIFLDEIGDLDNEAQIKLLRLIDSGEFYPLGSDKIEKSNARIIASTNRDLNALVAEGKFRQDLLFRLQSHTVNIPSLRERLDDLPYLIKYFVKEASDYINIETLEIPLALFDLLNNYSFPGNVRELKSMVYDAVIRNEGFVLSLSSFKNYLYDKREFKVGNLKNNKEIKGQLLNNFIGHDEIPTLKDHTASLISEAMTRAAGNQSEAARMLGITPSALNKRIKRNNLEI